jgi:hypothetical protein
MPDSDRSEYDRDFAKIESSDSVRPGRCGTVTWKSCRPGAATRESCGPESTAGNLSLRIGRCAVQGRIEAVTAAVLELRKAQRHTQAAAASPGPASPASDFVEQRAA